MLAVAICAALGAALGVGFCLVPGLNAALGLTLLVSAGLASLTGNLPAACLVAAAAGSSLYARRLAMVYNPAASSHDVASLDPAVQMTAEGRAADALRLMVFATDCAWLPALALAAVAAIAAGMGLNAPKALDQAIGFLGVPLVVFWAIRTSWKAKRRGLTALAILAMGVYGFWVLHCQAIASSQHAMSVLLAGPFPVAIAYQTVREAWTNRQSGQPLSLPAQLPLSATIAVKEQLALIGGCIGVLTGFFAGLGAGSLTSMFSALTEDARENYLLLTTGGEAANDVVALFLILTAGMGRSGEAILLGRLSHGADGFAACAILASLALGALAGRAAAEKLAPWYAAAIASKPVWVWSALVAPSALVPVCLAAGASAPGLAFALGAVAVGCGLSLWCRAHYLPNQALFGALALPLVFQTLGLNPVLNGLLFGM